MNSLTLEISDHKRDDLFRSPLYRAVFLTLSYIADNGPIGLTQTKSVKQYFVAWAAANFEWPFQWPIDAFRRGSIRNEADFPPLEFVHELLIQLRIARHYKGAVHITKHGRSVLKEPEQLFAEIFRSFFYDWDHAAYSDPELSPIGNWPIWLNIISILLHNHGSVTDIDVFSELYGPYDKSRDHSRLIEFRICVLKPLTWIGLLILTVERDGPNYVLNYTKSPLWQSILRLESDAHLAKRRLN